MSIMRIVLLIIRGNFNLGNFNLRAAIGGRQYAGVEPHWFHVKQRIPPNSILTLTLTLTITYCFNQGRQNVASYLTQNLNVDWR